MEQGHGTAMTHASPGPGRGGGTRAAQATALCAAGSEGRRWRAAQGGWGRLRRGLARV